MTSSRASLPVRIAWVLFFAVPAACAGQQRHPATGLVLRVDEHLKTAVISCNRIHGYMEAMTMNVSVPDAKDFAVVKPGAMIDFDLIADESSAYVSSVRLHIYQGMEPDPAAARRLKLLAKPASGAAKPVAVGDTVRDFVLTGQDGKAVRLSRFRGKVVALNFIYTRCALPKFCVRSTNNLSALQTRFRDQLKKNLVLLTVTFDPVHDSPEALKKYGRQWKADPEAWHFLTGPESAIRRVCDLFGEDYFPDEGLMDHSLHTAVIDRRGKLVANLEGNEFSARQLGDLVETILSRNSTVSPH